MSEQRLAAAAARVRPARRVLIAAGACLGLAAASLLLPSAPTTDPWGWIVWGREVAHLSLNTGFDSSPSWKPLPVLFTAPLSLLGDGAPQLWLVLARAGALAGLVLAYSLAARVAGWVAGVSAALFVMAAEGWIRATAHGYTEPMLDALILGAAERHLAGARRTSFALLALAALARPEAFAFTAAYGLWLVVSDTRHLLVVGTGLFLVPALWLGGDWWGSGNPLYGGTLAKRYSHLSVREMLNAIPVVLPVSTLMLGAGGLALAALRRERITLALGAWGLAWIALVVALPAFGGPGSARFLLPPAALVAVVAGVAVGMLARAPAGPRLRLAATVAALVVLVAIPSTLAGRAELRSTVSAISPLVAAQENLLRLAATVEDRSIPICGPVAIPYRLAWNRGALAWTFDTTINRIEPDTSARELPARSVVSFDSPPGGPPLPRKPSAGPIVRLPVRAIEMRLPARGALFLVPVRHARVAVEHPDFRLLYTVHDRNWTAAAVCPRRARRGARGGAGARAPGAAPRIS